MSAMAEALEELLEPDAIGASLPAALRSESKSLPAGPVAPASTQDVDELMKGLEDERFEVRLQCGRALARIGEDAPDASIDPNQVEAAVLRELTVEPRIRESQQHTEHVENAEDTPFASSNQVLEHVFNLLSLTFTQKPLLKIAFHQLHADDVKQRGLALEYLEALLPAAVRGKLLSFLESSSAQARLVRPREEIIGDLLRANPSIRINLAELEKPQQET